MKYREDMGIFSERSAAGKFRYLKLKIGREGYYALADEYLGDFPSREIIQKVGTLISASNDEILREKNSPIDSRRRVACLLQLHANIDGPNLFQRGLSDPYARIRCDTARFCDAGEDRSRLYNRLIRMIREDPDSRVRKAAGMSLSQSFADLYTLDFHRLPMVSQMLVLDSLNGLARSDEEKAFSVLNSSHQEAAFRAGRCLLKWGTLKRLFHTRGVKAAMILERCAKLGIVDYLDDELLTRQAQIRKAYKLALLAERNDLIHQYQWTKTNSFKEVPKEIISCERMEDIIMQIARKKKEIKSVPEYIADKNGEFKVALAKFFPPPEKDIISCVLFDIAKEAQWSDWADRCAAALDAEDPDIRCSAIKSLSALDSHQALSRLPALLGDAIDRVRWEAARQLALLPNAAGLPSLADYLSRVEDDAVLNGLKSAGHSTVAEFIVRHSDSLGIDRIAFLLNDGIDNDALKILAAAFPAVGILSDAIQQAGTKAGESMFTGLKKLQVNSKNRVISWILRSGWPESLIGVRISRSKMKKICENLMYLNADQIQQLLGSVLAGLPVLMRRRIKALTQ